MSQRPLPRVPGEVPNKVAHAPAGRRPRLARTDAIVIARAP